MLRQVTTGILNMIETWQKHSWQQWSTYTTLADYEGSLPGSLDMQMTQIIILVWAHTATHNKAIISKIETCDCHSTMMGSNCVMVEDNKMTKHLDSNKDNSTV